MIAERQIVFVRSAFITIPFDAQLVAGILLQNFTQCRCVRLQRGVRVGTNYVFVVIEIDVLNLGQQIFYADLYFRWWCWRRLDLCLNLWLWFGRGGGGSGALATSGAGAGGAGACTTFLGWHPANRTNATTRPKFLRASDFMTNSPFANSRTETIKSNCDSDGNHWIAN